MIKIIFECLKMDLKHNSEYIAIAQGKYKLPTTVREALQPLKEIKWLKK